MNMKTHALKKEKTHTHTHTYNTVSETETIQLQLRSLNPLSASTVTVYRLEIQVSCIAFSIYAPLLGSLSLSPHVFLVASVSGIYYINKFHFIPGFMLYTQHTYTHTQSLNI